MPNTNIELRRKCQKEWVANKRGKMTVAERTAMKDKSRRRVRDAVNQLKSEPCSDCGGTFPSECMDFDHLPEREEKFKVISLMINQTYSMKMIMAEIAKCDLVCSNCHRIRTKKRNNKPLSATG